MSLRSKDQILADLLPKKSGSAYIKAWSDFKFKQTTEFLGQPKEDDFLSYFDYLHRIKGHAPTTLWSIYSKLNNMYNIVDTGKKLQQDYPRLTVQLKRYSAGYERKQARVFSYEEIMKFLLMPCEEPKSYWLLRKCAAVLAFTGGLRCTELKSLTFESLEHTQEGYVVHYTPAKQRQELKRACFLVPYNRDSPSECFARHVDNYIDAVRSSVSKLEGDLFKTCLKQGFSKVSMGINYIYGIPKDIACMLQLPNPEKYTGHSFRRSSATHAADSGANSVELRRHYNWKDDQTANKYLEQSKPQMKHMADILTKTEVQSDAGRSDTNTAMDDYRKNVVINVHPGAVLNINNV